MSKVAKEFLEKRETNVVFLRLKRRHSEVFGQRSHGPNVYEISELFTNFGDIKVSEILKDISARINLCFLI